MKKDIILGFDGPDNVGKSTQIKKIRNYFVKTPFVVLNIESPVGENDLEKINYGVENTTNNLQATGAIFKKGIPQILDRTHFSEYAYSFFRGGHELEEFLKIEKDFEYLKESLFIIVFTDCIEKIQERDDGLSAFDPKKKEDIKKVIKNFEDISSKSVFKSVIININQKTEDQVFTEILEKIKIF
jgi:thymidylate kinase